MVTTITIDAPVTSAKTEMIKSMILSLKSEFNVNGRVEPSSSVTLRRVTGTSSHKVSQLN